MKFGFVTASHFSAVLLVFPSRKLEGLIED